MRYLPVSNSAAVAIADALLSLRDLKRNTRRLDLAGSGKISLEEFKKAATVEYLMFPAEKPARP